MKTIDLHLHLDGAITVPIAKKLAHLQGIELPSKDEEELKALVQVPADCPDLNAFLQCFELPVSLMQSPEGLEEAVRLVLADCEQQGVVYAELRFAPQLHGRQGMTQEDAVRAALSGLQKVNRESEGKIHANLILCLMRGEGNEAGNEETLRLAKQYLVPDDGVVAIDLAGAEALFPTENYRDIFRKAKEAGVPFTIHAGEAAGADSVRLAVEYGAARIGHGVRSEEDPEVVALLAEKKIPLEMCPTSNRQTHAVDDLSQYPLIRYLEAGIPVTVNTDDPAIEGTTLPEEYACLESAIGMKEEQKKQVLKNAIEAAFTTEEKKAKLRRILAPFLVWLLLIAQLLPLPGSIPDSAEAALKLSKKTVSMKEGTYIVVTVKKNTYAKLEAVSSNTSILIPEIVGDKIRLVSFLAGKATVKVKGYNKKKKLKKTVTISVTVEQKDPVVTRDEYGPDVMHTGNATYYDPKDSPGMAGLGDFKNKYFIAAMNTDDYMNDLAGAFVEVTGRSGETIRVLIVDMLVGAQKGDIDLSREAFQEIEPLATGRVPITWRVVPLPTDEPMRFQWRSKSARYWASLQVRNTVYPVKTVEVLDEETGTYIPLRKESYYAFTADEGLGSDGPFTFRITDIFGHELIEENIPFQADGTDVEGTKNFPALDNGEVC